MLSVILNVSNTAFQKADIFLCGLLRLILLSRWTGDRVTDSHSEYKPLYLMTEVDTDRDYFRMFFC